MANIVCIFAHPDDEAFGPGGTIATLSKKNDIFLVCVTDGNAKEREKDLGKRRKKELQESCKILGVKKVIFLGYDDGSLNNNLYHGLADKLREILEEIKPQTVITFEFRGISGHIDHVAVSFVTTFVVDKLPFVKNILYHCLDKAARSKIPDYFIYFPPGYSKKEINKTVDVSGVWKTKVKAMKCHKSQWQDVETILEMFKNLPKKEHFIEVRRKSF